MAGSPDEGGQPARLEAVDQVIVDEAQEFRKLSFATNMTNLKGVQPDGSQRAWDLYVKTRFIDTLNPGRALVMASGTPITNTLAEMYTLQRFMQPDALGERGLHEFDAWAATFGDSRTELELQPSGTYKPVTRFAEFVNVADLMAMFRSFADVVLKNDLRAYLKLPRIEGGQRQIITAEPSRTFKWYQRVLARRIKQIETRKRRPEKATIFSSRSSRTAAMPRSTSVSSSTTMRTRRATS
jgi:N12 class adenine-specific DNA methylase